MTIVSTFSSRSSASACLTSTPSDAPRPVPTMIAIGVASPSAHGHAMISTATALTSACASRGSGPQRLQPANAATATATTNGTNHAAMRSASRCTGARVRCASATIWTICASSVSRPTRSAFITMLPVPLTVPPVTRLPGSFATGIGSPVTIDSSIVVRPFDDDAVHRDLLAGTHAQLIADVDVGDRDVVFDQPEHAARGLRRQAEQPLERRGRAAARADLEHLAEQHQRGDDDGRVEVRLDAAVHPEAVGKDARDDRRRRRCRRRPRRRPTPISVNMLGLRLTSESHARVKNGHPAHSTTGVASASWIQSASADVDARVHRVGRHHLRHREHHHRQRRARPPRVKRRVMSISSTFGPSSSVTIAGSSAMPQIGQAPGALLPHLGVHRAGVDRVGIAHGAGAAA